MRVGEWPFCPHGFGNNLEEPLTPYFDEHCSVEGREFRTRGERRRFIAKQGLDYAPAKRKTRGNIYVDLGG